MTIYIDQMHGELAKYVAPQYFRMYSDDLEELHKMADLLGVGRRFYFGYPETNHPPHYDVENHKRQKAIKLGAQVVSLSEGVRIAEQLNERLKMARTV